MAAACEAFFFSLQLDSCGFKSIIQPCERLESTDLLPEGVSRSQLATTNTTPAECNLFACNVMFAALSRLPR
jgi:hypothetical protein